MSVSAAQSILPPDAGPAPDLPVFLFQAVHGADYARITHCRQERLQEDPEEQPGWPHCPRHRGLPQAVLLLHAPAQHQW